MKDDIDKVRIDKWLWTVRIYKTRSQATEACQSGKVKINGSTIKPSYFVKEGDEIHLDKARLKHIFIVNHLLTKRVSPSAVKEYLTDKTPENAKSDDRFQSVFYRQKGEGRPTKKERRLLDRIRQNE